MLGVAYLAVHPAAVAAGARIDRGVAARRIEPEAQEHASAPATVTELRPPAPAPPPTPVLPVGFRYDAVAPGPLQVVDGEGPTTKVCPDCAETVLHSARVCRHCRFRFDPPLSGSHAV